MTATFLLIRHAAHVHLDRLLSGRMPGVALSEWGERQAAGLAAALSHEEIDRVVYSPLDRTRATAEKIAGACPCPVAPLDGLLELDMGDWTGREIESLRDEPAWKDWNAQRATSRIPGGESMAEAQARIVSTLEALAAAAESDEEVVAVVSHADMIKAVVAHVLGCSLNHLERFDVGPASVTRVIWGEWGQKLMSLNERLC